MNPGGRAEAKCPIGWPRAYHTRAVTRFNSLRILVSESADGRDAWPGAFRAEIPQALNDFRATKADFSDVLIGRVNRSLGAQRTVTLDVDLKGIETFQLL